MKIVGAVLKFDRLPLFVILRSLLEFWPQTVKFVQLELMDPKQAVLNLRSKAPVRR
jgi:hypothetical protein